MTEEMEITPLRKGEQSSEEEEEDLIQIRKCQSL
jgi:hypothetical protein